MNTNLIASKNPKSPIAESYRMLRTNLQYIDGDREHKTMIVTSPNRGEGKTVTISNLAITMAEAGLKVLLIEADLRKPSIHKLFGLNNHHGLVSVINEKKSIIEAIRPIESVPNLEVMTSGQIPSDPVKILESRTMKDMIAEVVEDYDRILFDVPPVCSVPDTVILSSLVEGVLLVIASGKTNSDSAKRAIKQLDRVQANILGVVLSKVKRSKNSEYDYNTYEQEVNTKKKQKKIGGRLA